MKKLLLLGALLTGGFLCLQDVSVGHGGTYRGPGDTVPPGGGGGGGGGGPVAPGPAGPSSGGPAGPAAPAPATPGAPAGAPGASNKAPVTKAGAGVGQDLTVWQFWWEFNKEPYLNLKAKIHSSGTLTGSDDFFLGHGEKSQAKDSLRPSEQAIREKVVPALLRALDKEHANDIIDSSLIALAKIGDRTDESGESEFEKVIAKFLESGSQQIAESAAVSLGILANEASIPTLVSLMKDEPAGRKLVGSTEVPYRTRAFATYGLGLIGYRTSSNEVRQDIAEHMIDILNAPTFSTRDVKVAAMTALGLTPIDVVADPSAGAESLGEDEAESHRSHVLSRQSQLAFLMEYFDEENERANRTTREYFVRAHAPTAMARLLKDCTNELKAPVVDQLLGHIGKHSKARNEVLQSATLALGMIGDADGEKGGLDEKIRGELIRIAKDGEQQQRRFALIALAQANGRPGDGEDSLGGATAARKELLTQLSKGKTQMKPWAALALGVFGRQLLDNEQTPENSTAMALRSAANDCRRPQDAGAYLLALGVRRDVQSKDIILAKMDHFKGSDEARGYAAVSLGLMEERSAIEPIQDVVRNSKYKPELLKQAAIGLGLLGDKELVPELIDMLGEARGLSSQAAIASALGFIGDSRSIDPLVVMLANDQITDTARGFAAVALGIVCDKEPLPWNSKISTDINYRASTVTLTSTSTGTGILDIL